MCVCVCLEEMDGLFRDEGEAFLELSEKEKKRGRIKKKAFLRSYTELWCFVWFPHFA